MSDLIINKLYNVYEGGFNRGVIKRKSPRHSGCFVVYIHGRADYVFKDYKLKINGGDVFYLAKGGEYNIVIHEPSKYICIDFDFELIESVDRSERFGRGSAELVNKFKKYLHLKLSGKSENLPLVMSTLYDIYYEANKRSNMHYGRYSDFDKVLSYVLENYTDPEISLESIAAATDNSVVTLRRMFKSNLCITPIKYLNNLRFEKAKKMLEESNLSVQEIAAAVGFTDSFYFSRAFKHEIGLSPIVYRNEHR